MLRCEMCEYGKSTVDSQLKINLSIGASPCFFGIIFFKYFLHNYFSIIGREIQPTERISGSIIKNEKIDKKSAALLSVEWVFYAFWLLLSISNRHFTYIDKWCII